MSQMDQNHRVLGGGGMGLGSERKMKYFAKFSKMEQSHKAW